MVCKIYGKYCWIYLHFVVKHLKRYRIPQNLTLREMSLYSEVYTPYLSVFSPNAGKYGPEKLPIRTFIKQLYLEKRLFYMKGLKKIADPET